MDKHMRIDTSIQERKIELMGRGYLASEEDCPDCGCQLYALKNRYWSPDHSYSTGYTRLTMCPCCGYGDIYHDVE